MTQLILLEDERILREDLAEFLTQHGHSVQTVASIAEFERDFAPGRHLIALIDLGLPDGDGLDVITRLRQQNLKLGIIVLTARVGTRDKVAGLHSGADHYLAKTADLAELAATIEALARRLDLGGHSGNWVLDCSRSLLVPPGEQPVELSAQDLTVLKAIINGKGQPVSRRDIVAALGEDFLAYDERRMDTQMTRLRRKFASQQGQELPIKTRRNEGYQFFAPVELR